MTPTFSAPLLEAPASIPGGPQYQELAYLDAYDAVLDCDFAFLAYKETDGFGGWRVRIRSSQTAGAEFDPARIQMAARTAAAQGQTFFPWGFQLTPSAGDPRQVEFRVHLAGDRPQAIEMLVRLRRADGAADDPKSAVFPWPEA